MTTKHSPLPWEVCPDLAPDDWHLIQPVPDSSGVCQDDALVSVFHGDKEIQQANAEFIVRACNSHDALLAVLRSFVLNERHMDDPELRSVRNNLFAMAGAAIAQAVPNE